MDDMIGSNLTLLILPLAGAESAVALALLVAFYPLRGSVLLSWHGLLLHQQLNLLIYLGWENPDSKRNEIYNWDA